MADILITEFMDEGAVDRLRARFDVAYHPDLVERQGDIPPLMAGVKGLIVRNQTQVRGSVLEAADALQCVGRLGVGLDNIDVAACETKGVTVYPATGANADSVAEMALGAIFVLLRGIYRSTDEVIAGGWPRMALMGREVAGKRLGLIGFGTIAKALAWRAKGCGMTVMAWDPYVAADDRSWETAGVERVATPGEVYKAADVISVHTPLTDETRGLVDAEALSQMKSDALVLNPSRGGIVDEAALIAALKGEQIGGAFLDVFDQEPLPAENAFKDVPNLLLTPHVGARTREAEDRVSGMIADRVASHLGAGG